MKSARKLISVLLTAALLFAAVSVVFSVSAATSGIYTYEVSNGEATITRCSYSASGDITIPSTLGGYPVTKIGDEAFKSCSKLTSVTIPDSVTTIGGGAFDSCSNLTSVTIPNSVKTIGDYAFCYCSSLTSVTIPDSVTAIGSSVFGATALFSDDSNWDSSGCLYVGNHLIVAKPSVVSGAYSIRANTKTIADSAFSSCKKLTSVTITDSVTTIGYDAFRYCSKLTEINVSTSNPNYSSLEGILFNKDKTELIQYPNGNERTEYTIPNSVTTIVYDAFRYCSNLNSVTIPNSVTTIGEAAFHNCSNLTSITIPNSVTTIVDYAFESCTNLTSVTIPDSVTAIGSNVFFSTALYNNSSNWDKDGCLYIGNHLIAAGLSVISGAYSIRANTKAIAGYAFRHCENLTSVTIPDSVTTIGDFAFEYCSNLTSVTIPDSVTTIGIWAFYNCYKLTSATIGNSVTTIGHDAFIGCSKLTSVTIPNSVTTIGWYAFDNCSSLTDVYYIGTEEQWNATEIKSGNDPLLNANIHFIGAHEHEYTTEVIIEPTCTSTGLMKYTCTCGDSYTEEIPTLPHNYIPEIIIEPTCKSTGLMRYTCACGDSYTEEILTLSHNYITYVFPAGCVTAGGTVYVCPDCGYSYREDTAPTGHVFSDWQIVEEATCTESGLMEKYCLICGEDACLACGNVIAEEIPALGHRSPNEYGKCETCATLVVAGDVDGDGVITMRDTVMINRYIVDGCKYDPNGYAISLDETIADVNGDGKVSMLDTVMISRFVVDGGKTDPNGYNISLAPIG